MFLSILQAGIDRRVLINAVDINGKFKINATLNDILKIQKLMRQHYTMLYKYHLIILIKPVY